MTQIVPSSPTVAAIENAHRPSKTSSRSRIKAPPVIVELDSVSFAVAWTLMLLVRAVCIIYCVGAVFTLLQLDDAAMGYYVDLLRPGVKALLRPTAATYMLVAGAHTLQIVRMIVSSIQRNRLSLGGETNLTRPKPASGNAVVAFATRVWNELYSRYGFFGVESPYYEWRYFVRETIEIVSQSVQTYNSSALIGRPWINHLYVAIVVVNCVSTPILQQAAKRRKWTLAQERVISIIIDTMLDTGTAIVLPFALILPYARALDTATATFDIQHLYNDVWFINLINESRQIFPLSRLDFGVRFVAHVSIYLSLGSIRSILRPRRRTSRTLSGNGPRQSIFQVRVQETTRQLRRQASRARKWYWRPLSGRMSHLAHSIFTIWAVLVLGCHIVAFTVEHPNDSNQMNGCNQQLRPWFVTKAACTVYEYNCYRQGTDSMEPGALDFLDTNSLAVLIIAHCPALRVSPSIQGFPQLLGFEVFNCTLIEWSSAAAITAKTHPAITYAFLILTNLTEIPPGLAHSNLPPTLIDIEISHTNLSSVPDDLDLRWRNVMTLYIEYSELTIVPDALLRMKLSDFSLIGNHITDLPDFSISRGNYFMLALAENPIVALPPSMGNLKGVHFLNVAGTALTSLPDWISAFTQVYLTGTPYCESKSAAEVSKDFGFNSKTSCSYTDYRVRARYPLAITTPLRGP